ELWPYDTPAAVVEGALRTLLDGVSKEVSVAAPRGVPNRYLAAMGAAGTIPTMVAYLVGKTGTPFDVLQAVDRIATTIGHRFVIWVEELERFAGNGADDEDLEHSRRLAPLRALDRQLAETLFGSVADVVDLFENAPEFESYAGSQESTEPRTGSVDFGPATQWSTEPTPRSPPWGFLFAAPAIS